MSQSKQTSKLERPRMLVEDQLLENASKSGFDSKKSMASKNPELTLDKLPEEVLAKILLTFVGNAKDFRSCQHSCRMLQQVVQAEVDRVTAKLRGFLLAKEDQLRRGWGKHFEKEVEEITTGFNLFSSSEKAIQRRENLKAMLDHDRDEPATSEMIQEWKDWTATPVLCNYVQVSASGTAADRQGAVTIFGFHQIDPILRVQPYRKCFGTAAAVSAAYYRWIHAPNKEFPGVVDVFQYMRNNLRCFDLARFVFRGGGNTARTFDDFLGNVDPRFRQCSAPWNTPESVESQLKDSGPFLLAGFKGKLQILQEIYEGECDTDHNRGHALAVIGMRRVENKTFYLVQNWWEKLQFLEMDEEYLKSCEGELFYVPAGKDWSEISNTKDLSYATNTYHIGTVFIDGADLSDEDYFSDPDSDEYDSDSDSDED